MTIPAERTRAVLQTREFLLELTRNQSLDEKIREQARWCLRHYPTQLDIEIMVTEWESKIYQCPFGMPSESSS